MAPLPVTNTGRFWLDYTVGDLEHTLMWRFNDALVDPAYTVTVLEGFFSYLDTVLYTDFAILGARWAAAGSNFSLPYDISASTLNGFTGSGPVATPANQRPRELVYVGRSQASGRRARFSLYGAVIDTPGNYRIGPGEEPFTDTAIFAALNSGSGVGSPVAIDNTPVVWYPYANVNYNSYWETEVRTG